MRLLTKLLFIGLAFFSTQVYSQPPVEDDGEIRIETALVAVPTRVTDRQNKNLTGLKKGNFRLYEDGVEQTIESFDDANAPFTVALVLDVSDSTTAKLTNIKAAAIAFLEHLRPFDRVLIFNFDQNLVKVADGTAEDLSKIQNSIAFSQTGGGTSLYDSVVAVNRNYLSRISGKKALVIFTDGIDTQSVRETSAGSARAMEESEVVVYSIQYDTVQDTRKAQPAIGEMPAGTTVEIITARGERLPQAYKRGTYYLTSLANGTGGDFFYADTTENLSKTFARIAQELSQLYRLNYYPKNDTPSGKRRKIKITIDAPKAVVHSRKTYIYNRAKKKDD